MIDVNVSLVKAPQERPLQIYENVTIRGDLHLRNAKIGSTAALFVEDVPVNVNNMFDSLWTKSSNQTITGEITFEGGLTVDRLDTKYLNDFTESDFLYTETEEISSEFTNLHFENFHVDESFLKSDDDSPLFEILETETITIREELHLRRLDARDIFALTYNGINVRDIMHDNVTSLSGPMKLPAVRARRVIVDNLELRLLNDREVRFEDGLRVGDRRAASLKMPEFHVRSLMLERLNGTEMDVLTRLSDLTSSDLSRIVVDGDLTVENLTVDRIDGRSVESFLEELARRDIVITSEKRIDDLIVQNVTLESLRGQSFDTLIADILSKSREQTVPGHFSARVVTSDNITANFINDRHASRLVWVDGPVTIAGNVTFTDLFVDGDVIAPNMNGRDVQEVKN